MWSRCSWNIGPDPRESSECVEPERQCGYRPNIQKGIKTDWECLLAWIQGVPHKLVFQCPVLCFWHIFEDSGAIRSWGWLEEVDHYKQHFEGNNHFCLWLTSLLPSVGWSPQAPPTVCSMLWWTETLWKCEPMQITLPWVASIRCFVTMRKTTDIE